MLQRTTRVYSCLFSRSVSLCVYICMFLYCYLFVVAVVVLVTRGLFIWRLLSAGAKTAYRKVWNFVLANFTVERVSFEFSKILLIKKNQKKNLQNAEETGLDFKQIKRNLRKNKISIFKNSFQSSILLSLFICFLFLLLLADARCSPCNERDEELGDLTNLNFYLFLFSSYFIAGTRGEKKTRASFYVLERAHLSRLLLTTTTTSTSRIDDDVDDARQRKILLPWTNETTT